MKIGLTIFLIEDDDAIRLVLKHLFEHEGFLVFEAENGIEAIQKLKILNKIDHPDLILTDIQMPEDGQRVIDTLHQMEELKHIPIIPMSASGLSHISGKKVIPKPLNLKKLIRTVRVTILRDRKLHPRGDR